MPCLCSSPERKSTSNTPKRIRPDGMVIATGVCVAREFSTAVRLAGGLGHCLSLKPHLFSYLHRQNHSSHVSAFMHCSKGSLAPRVGAPSAISEHVLRAGQDEEQNAGDKNVRGSRNREPCLDSAGPALRQLIEIGD